MDLVRQRQIAIVLREANVPRIALSTLNALALIEAVKNHVGPVDPAIEVRVQTARAVGADAVTFSPDEVVRMLDGVK